MKWRFVSRASNRRTHERSDYLHVRGTTVANTSLTYGRFKRGKLLKKSPLLENGHKKTFVSSKNETLILCMKKLVKDFKDVVLV